MLFSRDADGVTSQVGYEIVRVADFVMVVGYANAGSLDTTALEQFTRLAFAKLRA